MSNDLLQKEWTAATEEGVTPPSSDKNEEETKPQVHFNLIQTLGLQFSLTAAPISIGSYLSLIIGLGGSPFYIWGFLFDIVFQMVVAVALAEIASAIPHSSGPAYWVKHLAPPRIANFLGHMIGWLTTSFWGLVCVSNALYSAQLTVALAMATNPGYNPPPWHYYLVYCAWCFAVYTINLPRIFKILPHTLTVAIVVINVSALYLIVALLVRATPKQSAHQVFVEVLNESGWSNGVVFFVALSPGVLTVAGFDCATHITDEVENPSKVIPQVIIYSAILSAVAGFAMTIVYSFCNVAPEKLLSPYGHQPLIQLIFDACRSDAISIIGSIAVIVSYYLASIGAFTSWNRLYWSFSREGTLPFPKTMSKLSSRDSLPLNALFINLILMLAMGAIQLGSLTALNAVLGGAVVLAFISYGTVLVLALRRRDEFLSKSHWFRLGRAGVCIQFVALIWCIFMSVWLCFPLYLPVTAAYMNYASVVVVGVIVMAGIYWIISLGVDRSM